MVSQVINLSNDNSFKLYKEKYNFSINHNKGLFGIELRNFSHKFPEFEVINNSNNIFSVNDNILIVGSFNEIVENISKSVKMSTLKSEVISVIDKFNKNNKLSYNIGGKTFDFINTYVMGILNVTPDSFSDGGKYLKREKAIDYAFEMIEAGADIIDVGGESTRPGSEPVNEIEEMQRVLPVISEIIQRKPDAIISIDTTKAKVAEEALKSGASLVNDISGGTFDKEIFSIVKDFDAAMVIMHIQKRPKTMQIEPNYSEVVTEVYEFLARQTEIALNCGITKIIIDPGIGFGKKIEDNLKLINRLEDFKSLGFPILIGLSRKSFIGNILNLPLEDRDDATNALNSIALKNGAGIIRTHNIKQAVQTCKIFKSFIVN